MKLEEQQNEYISNNYQCMSNEEIGESLGITAGRVAFFLRKLGLKRETKRIKMHAEKVRKDELRRKVKTKRRNYSFTPDERLIEICTGDRKRIDFGECIGKKCYCYGKFTCRKKQDRCLV